MLQRVRLYETTSGKQDSDTFFNQIVETLSMEKKNVPSKYAYGGQGTQLWFQMLEDPNYYLWNCDIQILSTQARKILTSIGVNDFSLIDIGAGDGKKSKFLLDAALQMKINASYIGIDISQQSNDVLEKQMAKYKGSMNVTIITSTYEKAIQWISKNIQGKKVFAILGGTIANLTEKELADFLQLMMGHMKNGQFFLIGQDLIKDPSVIAKAYNQPNYPIKGSPQAIKNIQNILGGNLGPQCFYPYLMYDPIDFTIKDFMISRSNQVYKIRDKQFILKKNEPILVFFSKKRQIQQLKTILTQYKFEMIDYFVDSKKYFANVLFELKK